MEYVARGDRNELHDHAMSIIVLKLFKRKTGPKRTLY